VVRLSAPRHVKDDETFDTDSRLFIEPNHTRMPESAAIAWQRAVMLDTTHNGNVKATIWILRTEHSDMEDQQFVSDNDLQVLPFNKL